ncbi:MAG: CHAT domain-containing tetratricopeptide repeat protein, partial [Acidobacteriota bacterium]
EYYEQALSLAREKKVRSSESYPLLGLSNMEIKRGNFEKAIEYLEQSLAVTREVKDRRREATILLSLSNCYQRMGRIDKAVEYSKMNLAIWRELGYPPSIGMALNHLAQAERKRDPAAARAYVEESQKIWEDLRRSLVTTQSRTQHAANVLNTSKLYTELLFRQNQAEPGKGLDALAFESSEFQRARSLLDLLAEAGADIRQGVDAALLERERTLVEQLSEKARLLTRAKPEEAESLKKEIVQLETDLERAQAAIRKASPNYAALTQPQPVKLSEIQAQLDADTVLLEYSLGAEGQDQSYLWAVTPNSLTTYELPKGQDIEKSAREVYELLTARSTNKPGETAAQKQARIIEAEAKLPSAAKELSRIILGPAAAQIGGKRLVIVADGALLYIPFTMLPDPATGGTQPLVVGHEIVSLPSASTLVFQRKELAGRQPAPKMLAVIADPVFDRTDVRFKTPVPEPAVNDASKRAANADTRTLEHIADPSATENGRLVIRRLPFTRQEADGILALVPKNSSFRETDFKANRSNVLSGDLAQYRYVHFATHGVMDSERPGLSALVLSTVNADGKPQNGFLRANDIYNMKLPAELVVLSACQTGLGKEVKGEGLIGLTRGFMYAGAKRVVVSLWSVNDKATADLMTTFYRGMLKNNERPAAALRAAQIEMWKQKKWQSPYYWAAFTMQGEYR